MKYRSLGKTGLQVSEIGFGSWGIGGAMWLGAKDEESVKALDRAMELGLRFIDTALVYGEGRVPLDEGGLTGTIAPRYPIPRGGFHCRISDGRPLSEATISQLRGNRWDRNFY